MVCSTVISQSWFCWLYKTSLSLAAKNIINLISVLTTWWCSCVESSLVLLELSFKFQQIKIVACICTYKFPKDLFAFFLKKKKVDYFGLPYIAYSYSRIPILLCFNSFDLLSHVWIFVNPWTELCQASLSVINFWRLLKLMFHMSVLPSNHLFLCHPFSPCLQTFPASRSFPRSQVFTLGG